MNLKWIEEADSFELHSNKPVLAILTVEDELQLFRGNRSNFADLLQTGKELGFITYVVTTKDLLLNKRRVKGYAYAEDTNTWHQRQFPLPDIIYNRIPYREDEIQPTVRRKLAAIAQHPAIRLFNPKFFDKWSLFEWLKLSKSTQPFIPGTRKLMSAAGLKRMLAKYPYLYLKPIGGKAGMGIMTIRLQPEKPKPYRLRVQAKKKSVTYRCSTLSTLWTRIKKQSSGTAYIAQQGIELASFHDRRFDLRALVQKNRLGQWDLTGIGARVAGPNSITTHVPRGGSIEEPEKLLVTAFGSEQARRILVRVKQTALLIAKQIERGSKSTLGEMSMDLGIDVGGNVWFFEANSKPMKFDEPHIRKKSLERIYHYGMYLNKRKRQAQAQEG